MSPPPSVCAAVSCALAHLVRQWSLWHSEGGLNSTASCVPALSVLARAFVPLRPWAQGPLRLFYDRWRLACSQGHQEELSGRLARVSWPLRAHPSPSNGEWRVAIVAGTTADRADDYRPFAVLWQCYAERHGYSFVMDIVTDVDMAPRGFEFAWFLPDGGPGRRDRLRPKRNWASVLAARRQLRHYDAVLVVDFDAFVTPACAHLPFASHLWPPGDRSAVVVRDPPPHQDPNMGVFGVRAGAAGARFLAEVLAKRYWLASPRPIANAFTETMLELLWSERAREGVVDGYVASCLPYAFADVDWSSRVADYAACFHRRLEALAGPHGLRASEAIRFVDPRHFDINYVPRPWEPTGRGFLHHHAGRKNWTAMLAAFGLTRFSASGGRACAIAQRFAQRLPACVPGTPLQECPHIVEGIVGLRVC